MDNLAETELNGGIRSLARIIVRYGEAYWPLLERLEEELHIRKARAARLKQYADRPEFSRRFRSPLTD